jgi:hypothetical protein
MQIIKDQIYEGKWYRVAWRNYLVACCDCGLTHSHNFKVINKKLYMKVKIEPKETRLIRKKFPQKKT